MSKILRQIRRSLLGNSLNLNAIMPIVRDSSITQIHNIRMKITDVYLADITEYYKDQEIRDTVDLLFTEYELKDDVHILKGVMEVIFQRRHKVYVLKYTGRITAEFDPSFEEYLLKLQSYLYTYMTVNLSENEELQNFYPMKFPETLTSLKPITMEWIEKKDREYVWENIFQNIGLKL